MPRICLESFDSMVIRTMGESHCEVRNAFIGFCSAAVSDTCPPACLDPKTRALAGFSGLTTGFTSCF